MARTPPLRDRLGAVIRRRRIALGISQEELAERAAMHRTYVGSVERGERNVSLDNIERLARSLGTTPSDLLAEAERGAPRRR